MKNRELIKLLKETRRKLTESRRAKKDWEMQSKFVDLLLTRADYRATVKRDMDKMQCLGFSAEATLTYMMGVWMATKGYINMMKEQGKAE